MRDVDMNLEWDKFIGAASPYVPAGLSFPVKVWKLKITSSQRGEGGFLQMITLWLHLMGRGLIWYLQGQLHIVLNIVSQIHNLCHLKASSISLSLVKLDQKGMDEIPIVSYLKPSMLAWFWPSQTRPLVSNLLGIIFAKLSPSSSSTCGWVSLIFIWSSIPPHVKVYSAACMHPVATKSQFVLFVIFLFFSGMFNCFIDVRPRLH